MTPLFIMALLASQEPATTTTTTMAAPADPVPTLRVAVYDFELASVEPTVGRIVTDALVVELRKLAHVSVVGMDEVRAMLDLEAQKQLVGCKEDESCLADIADALGVDGLVTGTLARVGSEHIVAMRRIDQAQAKVLHSFNERLVAGSGEELLAAVGPGVEKLFPEYPLRAGMKRGVSDELLLRLHPPPLDPWVFWSGVGTTAVVGVSGGLLVGAAVVLHADYQGLVERSRSSVVPATAVKERAALNNAVALSAWGTLGAAAVLGGVTGAVALFVDWDGLRDERAE